MRTLPGLLGLALLAAASGPALAQSSSSSSSSTSSGVTGHVSGGAGQRGGTGGLSVGRVAGTGGLNTGRVAGTGGLQGFTTDQSPEMATPQAPNVSSQPNDIRPLPQFTHPLPNQQALNQLAVPPLSRTTPSLGGGLSGMGSMNSGIAAGTEADASATGIRRNALGQPLGPGCATTSSGTSAC
jgi:hypothetical protein